MGIRWAYKQGQARHIYGPLVGFVVFMVWAYLLAPLLLVGAQVIAVLEERGRSSQHCVRTTKQNRREQCAESGRQSDRRLGLRTTEAAETINTTI
jgi:uncharacterized BrkB/YihY/UPF0761 family membrane protein